MIILCFRVVTFAILIVLACCPNVRRNYPSNLILLAIFVSVKLYKLILHVIFESIVCNFTHTHARTHMHAHMHAHAHTHTHTHTCKLYVCKLAWMFNLTHICSQVSVQPPTHMEFIVHVW